MRLTVIGSGYVGLVTAACFAEMGNTVHCVDKHLPKIEALKAGLVPIYEPGLPEMLSRTIEANSLYFTSNLRESLDVADICFIAVGTPMGLDGGADLAQVFEAALEIGRLMSRNLLVVIKSTVPVGTAARVAEIIRYELNQRKLVQTFKIVSNPEFLKEGSAVADCLSPDRVVIGAPDEESAALMKELYGTFVRTSDRFIVMDTASAEMTKYAANAMLATRVSFMNQLAGLCEALGADINQVRLGLGSDSRIGYSFLFPGCGYGGSCFPKDLKALIKSAQEAGCPAGLWSEVEEINRRQKLTLVEKVLKRFGRNLEGCKFAVWGLAFKPNTDDVREAPSMVIIRELVKLGAFVSAYDPAAMDNAIASGELPPGVNFARNKYEALDQADALLLVTEWKEFRSPDFEEIKLRLKTPAIFDGRNQYKASSLKKMGFEYHQIGVATG